MGRCRHALVVLALAALALPAIVGATSAPDATEGTGDARAGLVGADLEVEGLRAGEVTDLVAGLADAGLFDTRLDLGLLEGATSATTRDEPDALASLRPVRIGDDHPHDVSVGPGEDHEAPALRLSDVSPLLPGVEVAPFGLRAEADEDGALAVIDAARTSVDAFGAGGLDLGLTEVRSEVTRTGAAATQDLVVEDLAIGLGDVLPAELLELLPLDVLLDLLAELEGLGLVDGVADLEVALDGAVGEVESLVADVNDEAARLTLADEVDLSAVDDLLTERETLRAVEGDLADDADVVAEQSETLDGLLADPVSLDVGLLESVEEALEGVRAHIAELDAAATPELTAPAGCTDPVTEVDLLGLVSSAEDLLADADRIEACVGDLQGQVEGLLGDVLAAVEAEVAGLKDLVGPLLALLGDLQVALDGLLAAVEDILGEVDGVAALPLLTADRLELAVHASADAQDGATSIVCDLGGVAVLGAPIGDLDCEDGVLDGPGAEATRAALGAVSDVLTTLPGVETADGLRLELLPDTHQDVTRSEDGTVTATAQAVLLEFAVPSVTIDPEAFVEGLLDLPALTDGLVADIEAELAPLRAVLDDAGLGALVDATAGELVDDIGGPVTVVDGLLEDVVPDVLDTRITTPSIALVLDPTSEATFTAMADAQSNDLADAEEEPEVPVTQVSDTATPELPKTGGGLALLGLAGVLGAVGLRRRTG